jgi:hypothetical protein
MAFRCTVVLAVAFALFSAASASAAESVEPRAGVMLTGRIDFPRAQRMTIRTDRSDGTRLTVAMGFNGRCRGGGLGEVFVSNVKASPKVRVRDGRISANLTGTSRSLGGGRTGVFRWKLTGRFTERDVVVATVTGSAEVRDSDGETVSKCKIDKPADVRLAIRSA